MFSLQCMLRPEPKQLRQLYHSQLLPLPLQDLGRYLTLNFFGRTKQSLKTNLGPQPPTHPSTIPPNKHWLTIVAGLVPRKLQNTFQNTKVKKSCQKNYSEVFYLDPIKDDIADLSVLSHPPYHLSCYASV